MIITSSNIQMASSHSLIEQHQQQERLALWREGDQASAVGKLYGAAQGEGLAAKVRGESGHLAISDKARALQPQQALLKGEGEEHPEMDDMDELKVSLLKLLVESLTGKEMKLVDPEELELDDDALEALHKQGHGQGLREHDHDHDYEHEYDDDHDHEGGKRLGWGMVYDYYESHYESETTQFSAQGLVQTADGQTIQLDLSLNMSREFASEQRISLKAGDALKDPLVVNFNGNAAALTETRFSFDIDSDGRADQIAFVRPGSGFLALDKNQDGQINDGSELFGAVSGNGFAELAQFDDDGNGWIDAGDSIYQQLRIWSKDAEGNDQLLALGQQGVGAIYLGHIETPFLIKDSANQTQGQVRDSGLYLGEDGGVGSVQQIDLVV